MNCFIFATEVLCGPVKLCSETGGVFKFFPFPSSKHQSLNTVFPTLIINHCELLHSPKMNFWNKLNHFFPMKPPPCSLSGTEPTKVLTAFAVRFVLGEQPEHQDH